MSSDVNKQIKYDKINTKYNRLWEQLTNMSLFILASFVAYSIAYLQDNTINVAVFLTKIIIPLLVVLIFLTLTFGILLTLLVQTGKKLHDFLKSNKINC